jgi:repressor LexA
MKNIKEREKNILSFMKKEIRQKGYPPTVREICQALGIKSTSTVHKDIENLVNAGYIIKDPSKPRALNIVDDVPNADGFKKDGVERTDVVDIPIVGSIAAGTPILAEQNIEESFPLPARYVSRGADNFMLKVKGESMVEAGIMDGDLILVEQQNTARNGDIVVAMIDGFESEATVKTFYREDDHVRLQPENSSMSPIIVKDVTILGKVRGVFRYF